MGLLTRLESIRKGLTQGTLATQAKEGLKRRYQEHVETEKLQEAREKQVRQELAKARFETRLQSARKIAQAESERELKLIRGGKQPAQKGKFHQLTGQPFFFEPPSKPKKKTKPKTQPFVIRVSSASPRKKPKSQPRSAPDYSDWIP